MTDAESEMLRQMNKQVNNEKPALMMQVKNLDKQIKEAMSN